MGLEARLGTARHIFESHLGLLHMCKPGDYGRARAKRGRAESVFESCPSPVSFLVP